MQSIEINTAQNVPIVYELAGFRDRFMAYIVDLLIMGGAIFVINILMMIAFSSLWNTGSEVVAYVVVILYILIFFFYTPVMEMLNNGQSFGKMALKIKVVRLDGAEVSSTDILTRWMFRMLDIYFSAGSVAAMLVSSTEKCQRLGDLMANTTVIRLQPRLTMGLPDLMKIQSIATYTPKFPDARKLHEDDMLIVKHVLERYAKYPNGAHSVAVNTAARKIADILLVDPLPKNRTEFLKTVLKDYVVLTR